MSFGLCCRSFSYLSIADWNAESASAPSRIYSVYLLFSCKEKTCRKSLGMSQQGISPRIPERNVLRIFLHSLFTELRSLFETGDSPSPFCNFNRQKKERKFHLKSSSPSPGETLPCSCTKILPLESLL